MRNWKKRNRKKRQKVYSGVKKRSDAQQKAAKTLRGHEQKERTESASRVRNRKKRQKLCSGVKEKSRKGGITAESLRGCEQKVRAECADRMCRQDVRTGGEEHKIVIKRVIGQKKLSLAHLLAH